MKHKLRIHSLRDLDASCSCDKWSLCMPTSSYDTRKNMLRLAREEFRFHHLITKDGDKT